MAALICHNITICFNSQNYTVNFFASVFLFTEEYAVKTDLFRQEYSSFQQHYETILTSPVWVTGGQRVGWFPACSLLTTWTELAYPWRCGWSARAATRRLQRSVGRLRLTGRPVVEKLNVLLKQHHCCVYDVFYRICSRKIIVAFHATEQK